MKRQKPKMTDRERRDQAVRERALILKEAR